MEVTMKKILAFIMAVLIALSTFNGLVGFALSTNTESNSPVRDEGDIEINDELIILDDTMVLETWRNDSIIELVESLDDVISFAWESESINDQRTSFDETIAFEIHENEFLEELNMFIDDTTITETLYLLDLDELLITNDDDIEYTWQNDRTEEQNSTQSTPFLNISPSTDWLGIAPIGGAIRNVTISTNIQTPITINRPAWLDITSISGGFRLTVQQNSIAAVRSGSVVVSGGGLIRGFNVSQQAASPFLTITPTTNWTSIPAAGGATRDVLISTNIPDLTLNKPHWLNVANISGGVRLTAQTNPLAASRSDIVSISGGGITRSFTATQLAAAPFLNISPTTNWSNIPAAGGATRDVTISTNITTQITVYRPPWLNVTNINGGIRLTAQANPIAEARTGTVSIVGGGITRSFTVSQLAAVPFLTISPNTPWLSLSSAGGQTRTVSIQTNIPSINITIPAWTSGVLIDGGFRLTTLRNDIAVIREGTVSVSGNNLTENFAVSQLAPDPFLEIWPTSDWLNLPAAGGVSRNVQITSNIPSITLYRPSWLNVVNIDGGVRLTIQANVAFERSSGIIFTGGGLNRTFIISQENGFIWHSDSNWIGYWPDAITIGTPETRGVIPVDFEQNLQNSSEAARLRWGGGLWITIGQATHNNASIQVFGGSLLEMQYESGDMRNWAGLCSYAPRTRVLTTRMDNSVRSIYEFSGQARTFVTYGSDTEDWSTAIINSITVHEVGHALGWAGHAPNLNDVMYFQIQRSNDGNISNIEARHLRQLYNVR